MFNCHPIKSNSLSNLEALSCAGVEIGFIHKPRDTRTDKNAWRCFVGIGEAARFVGHRWDKATAKQLVCDSL